MLLCAWEGFVSTATDSARCASWWRATGLVLLIAVAVVLAIVGLLLLIYARDRQNIKEQRAVEEVHACSVAAILVMAQQLTQDLAGIYAVVQQPAEEQPLSPAILLRGAIALERARRDFEALADILAQNLLSDAANRSVKRLAARVEEALELLEPPYFTALNRLPNGNIVAETAALRVPGLLHEINYESQLLRHQFPQRPNPGRTKHG